MTFRVELSRAAKQDLRGILDWLREQSHSGAQTWFRRWSQVLQRLVEQGDTLGLAPEDADHEQTIHQIIFRTRKGLPCRALFVVRDETVFVLRVRGPGQDDVAPEEMRIPD